MIATLTLLIFLQADWSLEPIFPTVFPHPTGADGMEDYVLAMDALRTGHFNAYEDWQSPEVRGTILPNSVAVRGRFLNEPQSQPDPRFSELVNRLDQLDYLQIRQEESKQFGRALDLVASGNGKNYSFPTPVESFKFPALSDEFGLMHLACNAAYADLADAQSAKSVEDITRVLVMSDRLARHNHFSALASIIAQASVLAWISENIDRFSIGDAKEIETVTNAILQQRPAFFEAYRNEFLHAKDSVRNAILSNRNSQFANSNDKLATEAARLLDSASDADVDSMIKQAQQAIVESGDLFFRRLQGPEETWLLQPSSDEPAPSLKPPKSLSEMEAIFARNWTPTFARDAISLLPVVKSRTKLRLARLYARVIQFHWEWGRLPANLGELGLPREYEFDPLSNQPFIYESDGERFRIYSSGFKQSGQVDLSTSIANFPNAQEVHP